MLNVDVPVVAADGFKSSLYAFASDTVDAEVGVNDGAPNPPPLVVEAEPLPPPRISAYWLSSEDEADPPALGITLPPVPPLVAPSPPPVTRSEYLAVTSGLASRFPYPPSPMDVAAAAPPRVFPVSSDAYESLPPLVKSSAYDESVESAEAPSAAWVAAANPAYPLAGGVFANMLAYARTVALSIARPALSVPTVAV